MGADVVVRRFEELTPPATSDAIAVVKLRANAFLGVHSDGSRALFFQLQACDLSTTRRVTRALDLVVSQSFLIVDSASGPRSKVSGYAILLRDSAKLWCFSAVVDQVQTFLESDERAFETDEAIDAYVATWVEFFSQDRLSVERAVGLWGELFVLSKLPDRERGVVTWVGATTELFDFVGNGVRLEVKTSIRSSIAWFNLEQVEGKDTGYVVFLRVLPDRVAGISLDTLVDKIYADLPAGSDFEIKLMQYGYARGDFGSLILAAQELCALRISDVPRPNCEDRRVKAIRFSVDIDSLSNHFLPSAPIFQRLIGRTLKKPRIRSAGSGSVNAGKQSTDRVRRPAKRGVRQAWAR